MKTKLLSLIFKFIKNYLFFKLQNRQPFHGRKDLQGKQLIESRPLVTRFKAYCFELLQRDASLVRGIFGQCMGSVAIRHLEEFGQLLFVAAMPVQKVNNNWGTRRPDHMSTLSLLNDFHFYLKTSRIECSNQLIDPSIEQVLSPKKYHIWRPKKLVLYILLF